jgi:two-component system, OmpR family, response regulator TctD
MVEERSARAEKAQEKMRILLVEDAEDQGDAIVQRLRRAGYGVDWATDGEMAVEYALREEYDLILLDLILPGLDGSRLLKLLRERKSRVPVLITTARREIDVKVNLLDIGADDYIVKPFDLQELEARVRALLRRPYGHVASSVRVGNVVFDAAYRRVQVDGRNVALGAREFRLLELFLGNVNRVLTKDAIMDHLFSCDDAVSPNAIELYVSRLRSKLAGASIEIRTLRGEGYALELHEQP